MKGESNQIQWAPKVSQAKIRNLYEADAKGIIDEKLIDEVAYALYMRCQSILEVTEASRGRVRCPVCGSLILRQVKGKGNKNELLECSRCSWQIRWEDYHKSYNKKQLHGGSAVHLFQRFVEHLPQTRTPQEKMMLIDTLLHEFHTFCKGTYLKYTRPVAANLIQGTATEVIRFLDNLTYGVKSPAQRKKVRDAWRKKLMNSTVFPYSHRSRKDSISLRMAAVSK